MALERLQKIIAAAGIASRRKAEELIQAGLVSVNGAVITELGSKADPDTDSIRVNSKLLEGPERHEYVALNKPRGYVTTVSDPEGRPTVMELVRSKARLYPIGRLDFNSEGLLLMTNDGSLAHKLMKAASHIPKTYLVKVAGQPGEDQLRRLRAGVSIAEERDPGRRVRTAPAQIRVIKEADNPWLEVTLHEGRNRQIRKMFEEIGHHVEKIRRVRYGPLELDLTPGESRPLSAKEVSSLEQATHPEARRPRTGQGNRGLGEDRRPAKRPEFRSERFRKPVQEREGGEAQSEFSDGRRGEDREQRAQTDGRFPRRDRTRTPSRPGERFRPAADGKRESRLYNRQQSRDRSESGGWKEQQSGFSNRPGNEDRGRRAQGDDRFARRDRTRNPSRPGEHFRRETEGKRESRPYTRQQSRGRSESGGWKKEQSEFSERRRPEARGRRAQTDDRFARRERNRNSGGRDDRFRPETESKRDAMSLERQESRGRSESGRWKKQRNRTSEARNPRPSRGGSRRQRS